MVWSSSGQVGHTLGTVAPHSPWEPSSLGFQYSLHMTTSLKPGYMLGFPSAFWIATHPPGPLMASQSSHVP